MSTLLSVTGRTAGVRWALEGEETVVGRASDSTIQVLEEAVSRRHFVIRKTKGGHRLEDLGGQSGTLLNGVRVTKTAELRPGDVIAAGPATFVFDPSLDYLRSGQDGQGGTDVIIEEAPLEETDVRTVAGDEGEAGEGEVLLELLARSLEGGGDVVGGALEVVARRFGAERAFVLADRKAGRPKVVASFGEGPITVSRTVVERVLSNKEAVMSGDAPRDVAFSGGVSLLAGEIRSLLAAPLVLDGRAVGMVHLDRRNRNAYRPADLESLIGLSNVLALVLLASRGIEALRKKARSAHRVDAPSVVAESGVMKRVLASARRAAKAEATVLLTGETGTGKEVLARLIHTTSARRNGPFVAVNCGALPESLQESELFGHEKGAFTGATSAKVGLFEAADGGTLFLDEVAECSRAAQVKLLRALQERVVFRVGATRPIEVDVRIVAATSRNLEDMLLRGQFREDLYFRLKVVHLAVPPLRDRVEDVGPLAVHFAEAIALQAGVTPRPLEPELLSALERHPWPGNVRELQNVVERLVILSEGPAIRLGDLPADLLAGRAVARQAIRKGETLQAAVAEVEREMILRAMDRTGGVKSATADALGISRVTLDAKLRAHRIPWRKKR